MKLWKGENEEFRQDLEWLKTWIRDLLVQRLEAAGSDTLLNPDFAVELAEVAPLLRPDHLLEIFELLCAVQRAISYNINKRLSLEVLLLIFRSLTTGGGTGSRARAIRQSIERKPLTFHVCGWLR